MTITGTDLGYVTAVDFGPDNPASILSDADGQIMVSSPAATNDLTGTVDVTVTTLNGTSAISQPADQFTYTHAPFVSYVSTPNEIQNPADYGGVEAVGLVTGGDAVTIHGNDLDNVTAVDFGNTPADLSTLTYNAADGSITLNSPPGTAGTVDITVTTSLGTSDISPDDQFAYVAFPSVTSVSPSSASVSSVTQVTISGTGLGNATEVYFGPWRATTIISDTDGRIVVESPNAALGTVDVTVTTPFGTSATSTLDQFTYEGPPMITAQDVSSGPVGGGTLVTLTGTSLANATVDFGANPGTIIPGLSTDSQIVVVSPEAANDNPGLVDLTVTTAFGSSTAYFTYALPPAVTMISQSFGPAAGGTMLTISGDNLSGATAVDFGGVPAASFTDNGDGTLSAVSPAGAVATVDVTVVALGGTTATSPADRFTYLAAPSVLGISPAAGPLSGGTVVTITGTGLADATEVDFGGFAATNFTFNPEDGTITVASPPDLGYATTEDVTVITAGGTSATSASDQFTYAAVPSVTSIGPTWGSTVGNDVITIYGTDLDGATAVHFGGRRGLDFLPFAQLDSGGQPPRHHRHGRHHGGGAGRHIGDLVGRPVHLRGSTGGRGRQLLGYPELPAHGGRPGHPGQRYGSAGPSADGDPLGRALGRHRFARQRRLVHLYAQQRICRRGRLCLPGRQWVPDFRPDAGFALGRPHYADLERHLRR